MASIKNILNRASGIEWLVIKNTLACSDGYNQMKTLFSNGWGISIIAKDSWYEMEVHYLTEDFKNYYTFEEKRSIIEMIKIVESYER